MYNFTIKSLSLLLLTMLTAVTSAADFIPLGDFRGGEFHSSATVVSDDGAVIGGYGQLPNRGLEAFLRTGETELVGLGRSGNRRSQVRDLSSDGSVAAGFVTDFSWSTQSFRWTLEDGREIIGPGTASAISNDGTVIAGTYVIDETNNKKAAYRWTRATGVVSLGNDLHPNSSFAQGISGDGSVVVGYACDPCEAFRWTEETGMVGLGDFGNDPIRDSRAFGVSDDGSVVVGYGIGDDGMQASRWTSEEGMQALGFVPGDGIHDSFATAASSDGSTIVGYIGNDFSGVYDGPFIWNADDGMQRLQEVLINDYGLGLQLDDWTLIGASDISADGRTIVGSGRNPDGNVEGWVAVLSPAPCDLNTDGRCDVADIDILTGAIMESSPDVRFDLNGDMKLDLSDHTTWVKDLKNVYYGDANLDGQFNQLDIVAVMQAGQFNDKSPLNSTWSTGDWNGDKDFTNLDIVAALQDGGYGQGPLAATLAVPEPTTIGLLLFGLPSAALLSRYRKRPLEVHMLVTHPSIDRLPTARWNAA